MKLTLFCIQEDTGVRAHLKHFIFGTHLSPLGPFSHPEPLQGIVAAAFRSILGSLRLTTGAAVTWWIHVFHSHLLLG